MTIEPEPEAAAEANSGPDGRAAPAIVLRLDGASGESWPCPPVVGIGASAGGLEAFTRVVSHLERDTGLAYVLVTHLDPIHESLLPEILGRASPVPVLAAADGMRIAPDTAYVIPPGALMTVTDGHLRVVQRERARGVHTVIDAFLESLSQVHESDAVGVILSGAGSDGSRGIVAIKERGGITIAQDPHSAQFSSMPDCAIATGCIDFVLPPEEIAEQLVKIGRLSAVRKTEAVMGNDDRESSEKILLMLRDRTGVDFQHYRSGTVQRRILRRMLVKRHATHSEYLASIRANPGELDLLCEDILIGVTRFFRDPEAFATLQETAFPEMMKERPTNAPVRVWIAGCSGGEEAFSVAILLLEYLGDGLLDTGIQIFATDLSDVAITRARTGIYSHNIEEDVSPERLRRFFVREDRGYRVTRRVRDICVFAKHNLVRDPPFSQLDLITCRNVLIYFDAALQERAIKAFHYGLKPNGLLLLGKAESAAPQHFLPLDRRHKVFRPQPGAPRSLEVGTLEIVAPIQTAPTAPRAQLVRSGDRALLQTAQQDADRAVLHLVAPPGVVVNERLEITQFRGDTTGFLQHPAGTASLHLLKLVRPEFLPRLRAAIERSGVDAAAVREEEFVLRDGDSVRHVSIDVIPFRSGSSRERFFVILFDDESIRAGFPVRPLSRPPRGKPARRLPSTSSAAGTEAGPDAGPDAGADAGTDAAHRIAELREELAESKHYLQDVVEQYEGANEELRAASEEIQSSNEELQSTNEELETTKEEVQSTNEELTTVNEELRHRNREMAAISGDLANVFASTQIPVVIIDSTLLIRRFTPISERVMKVIATDIGRPLGDIKLRFDLPDLDERVTATIGTLELSQADVQDDQGRWWALTIRPYLTVDRKVDGAVLVFTDIDAAKKYGERADETSERQRELLTETEGARAEASAANLTKIAFLANMSHDLRTPLNAIAGYADLMELGVHGPLTSDQESDLARIKRSARHLLSLINDILNFAKVERGHLDLSIVAIRIVEVVNTLGDLATPQVRAKGLRFELEDCDGTVMADPDKLQQLLLNLVTNAIKFTASGAITVRCIKGDATIRIEVCDTGAGIAEDQLVRIFEPFIQVGRSLTNVKHEGVGLGLSISRDLARAMGGDISVVSKVGEGSVFTVTLPCSED
jgi:two-component system CheB/CheR fusion protein